MSINRTDPTPLNTQVAEDLRRRIRVGEYSLGERFPSLRTLASEYEVAELTVHAAVRELQREGVLESVIGRGTFVRAVPEVKAVTEHDRPSSDVDLAEVVRRLDELSARLDAMEHRLPAE